MTNSRAIHHGKASNVSETTVRKRMKAVAKKNEIQELVQENTRLHSEVNRLESELARSRLETARLKRLYEDFIKKQKNELNAVMGKLRI